MGRLASIVGTTHLILYWGEGHVKRWNNLGTKSSGPRLQTQWICYPTELRGILRYVIAKSEYILWKHHFRRKTKQNEWSTIPTDQITVTSYMYKTLSAAEIRKLAYRTCGQNYTTSVHYWSHPRVHYDLLSQTTGETFLSMLSVLKVHKLPANCYIT